MTGTIADRRAVFGTGAGAAPAPPPGMAIEHGPTAEALRRHGRRGPAFLAVGVVAVAVAVGLASAGAPERIWLFACSFAGAALAGGVWLVLRHRWMGEVLRTSPWVARHGRYHVVSPRFEINYPRNRHAVLILEADEHGPEVLCTVPELRWRLDALAAPGGPVDVWVAGDPTRRAVATLRGEDVVPIRQPRTALWRRVLRRRVERQIARAEGR